MRSPTSRDPVKAMKRVRACATSRSPNPSPAPGQKFTTPSGNPASVSRLKKNRQIAGDSVDGLSTTVLPHTMAAIVMPAMMAPGKFHGGITTPTPSGRYHSNPRSPGNSTGGRTCASRSASRA